MIHNLKVYPIDNVMTSTLRRLQWSLLGSSEPLCTWSQEYSCAQMPVNSCRAIAPPDRWRCYPNGCARRRSGLCFSGKFQATWCDINIMTAFLYVPFSLGFSDKEAVDPCPFCDIQKQKIKVPWFAIDLLQRGVCFGTKMETCIYRVPQWHFQQNVSDVEAALAARQAPRYKGLLHWKHPESYRSFNQAQSGPVWDFQVWQHHRGCGKRGQAAHNSRKQWIHPVCLVWVHTQVCGESGEFLPSHLSLTFQKIEKGKAQQVCLLCKMYS